MGQTKSWLKKYWWILILGIISLGVVIWLIVRPRKGDPLPLVSFSNKAREQIVEAQTDAAIEKLKIEAMAEEKRRALDLIAKMQGGIERRKALADFLDKNF